MFTGEMHAASNRADYGFFLTLVDADTKDEITLTGSTINVAIKAADCATPALTASSTDGRITLPTTTSAQVAFTPTDMRLLCEGSYKIGVTVETVDGVTYQALVALLQVVDGVVA